MEQSIQLLRILDEESLQQELGLKTKAKAVCEAGAE